MIKGANAQMIVQVGSPPPYLPIANTVIAQIQQMTSQALFNMPEFYHNSGVKYENYR
jgi:hypothetical protein